jgi:hypothetical protein
LNFIPIYLLGKPSENSLNPNADSQPTIRNSEILKKRPMAGIGCIDWSHLPSKNDHIAKNDICHRISQVYMHQRVMLMHSQMTGKFCPYCSLLVGWLQMH